MFGAVRRANVLVVTRPILARRTVRFVSTKACGERRLSDVGSTRFANHSPHASLHVVGSLKLLQYTIVIVTRSFSRATAVGWSTRWSCA